MRTLWGILGVLALCCIAWAEDEDFNVYSTLRKSNFSVSLRESTAAEKLCLYI